MTGKSEPQTYPDSYYAGAYWSPRKESPEECARRAVVFLNSLAACDPLLAHWNSIPKPRGRGLKTPIMPPDVTSLTEAFRRGVNREPGGPAIEHLGLTVGAYNDGARQDHASLSMRCGSYGEGTSNACVLNLPSEGANADRVLTHSVLSGVVRSMAVAWDPDWAVATSSNHRDTLSEKGKAGTFAGWVTYLSRRRGTVPPLPVPVRIEPVEDRGALVILTPERLTASPEHVEIGRHVGELLARAGLMQPIAS